MKVGEENRHGKITKNSHFRFQKMYKVAANKEKVRESCLMHCTLHSVVSHESNFKDPKGTCKKGRSGHLNPSYTHKTTSRNPSTQQQRPYTTHNEWAQRNRKAEGNCTTSPCRSSGVEEQIRTSHRNPPHDPPHRNNHHTT